MIITDYDIVKKLMEDLDFQSFLKEKGPTRTIPVIMHYLSENYGYTSIESARFAKSIANELVNPV